MKFLQKLSFRLFALIIFVISTAVILSAFKIIQVGIFSGVMIKLFANDVSFKITVGAAIVLFLMSLRFIFFRIGKEEFGRDGIVLENSNGKLVISKESLENMVSSSTKQVDSVEYVNSRTYVNKEHKLLVYVTILVPEGVLVKEASKKIQDNIKENMKNTADLEVSSVLITVKNIVTKKEGKKSSKTKEKAEVAEKPEEVAEKPEEVVEKPEESEEDNE